MGNEIPPDWAIERALSLGFTGTRLEDVKRHWAGHTAHIAFARYIAEHEEPPVDPLLVEAREIAAGYCTENGCNESAEMLRAGRADHWAYANVALAALRRGMELAREQSK